MDFDHLLEGPQVQFKPGGWFSSIYLDGVAGEEIDFANDRLGTGWNARLQTTLQPTDSFDVDLTLVNRVLNIDDESGEKRRLFSADIQRLRSTLYLNANAFLRLIVQRSEISRDPSLYNQEVTAQSGDLTLSFLLAYKLNWQSVAFLGYGDYQQNFGDGTYQSTDQQWFLKLSYAYRH